MSDQFAALRAQLDDDERIARAVGDGLKWPEDDPLRRAGLISDSAGDIVAYDKGSPDAARSAHIVRHDPARVVRDVAAMRRLLAPYDAENGPGGATLSRAAHRACERHWRSCRADRYRKCAGQRRPRCHAV